MLSSLEKYIDRQIFSSFILFHVQCVFHLIADESFCKDKLDGYYLDPRDCAAFYQCSRGSTFRQRCSKGQVFNDILKSCDSPMNFPCRQRSLITRLNPNTEKVLKPTISPKIQLDIHAPSPNILQRGMYLRYTCCSALTGNLIKI